MSPHQSSLHNVYYATLLGVVVWGCPRAELSFDAGFDAGPVVVDAGPASVPELSIVGWVSVDGGAEVLLPVDGGVFEGGRPTALRFIVTPQLVDWRLRLFDFSDRVVASDDEIERIDGGFEYRLRPLEPLASGRTYSFTLESQSGAALTDGNGTQFDDARHAFSTSGTPEPEPKQPRRRRR
jgi:hypothetical protein